MAKSIKSIKTGNNENSLLTACEILKHRPNIRNKTIEEFKKHKAGYMHDYTYYWKGYEEGYQYAIERLLKHSKK